MTHEDAFLQDILEHPADDAPRLIFADWLEENGNSERAEFIRVQCAIAVDPFAHNPPPSNPRCACNLCTLRRRERELLSDAVHWWDWLADFYRITGRSAIEDLDHCSDSPHFAVRWRRGFVAEVTLPCQAWMDHGPELVRVAPLERVTLWDRTTLVDWPPLPDRGPFWVTTRYWDELRNRLPREFRPRLRGATAEDRSETHDVGRHYFASEASAQEALSDAALAWARSVPLPDRAPAR
jgi:uncharacterized protein (TIGR02996 family)